MNENAIAKGRGKAWYRPLTIAGMALLTWLVWGWVLELGMLGWDSYPLIAAGRVSSPAELFGTLGEELMDGRYPLGHFWRPVLHWSFALDYWVHGLDAWGYHLTDLVLLASVACVLVQLGRRLSPSSGWLAGISAGLLWLLHPVQLEVLSVPARRAETLSILFTCLALSLVLSRRAIDWKRSLCLGCLCACAFASKETGIIALALVLLAGWTCRGAEVNRLRSFAPAIAVVLLAIACRTWVLGGLGGSADSSVLHGLPSSSPYLTQLLFPSWGLGVPSTNRPAEWLVYGLPLVLVIFFFRLRPGKYSPAGSSPVGPLLIFWLALMTSLSAMSGIEQNWYALPFLAPLALWIGCLAAAAWQRLKHPRGVGRPVAIGGLLLSAALLTQSARISIRAEDPRLFLPKASAFNQALIEQYLNIIQAQGSQDPPGLALAEGFSWNNGGAWGAATVRMPALAPYSLQALGDLVLGSGQAIVHVQGTPVPTTANQRAKVVQVSIIKNKL